MKRILFNIILLGVVFYAPWWLTFMMAAFGIFYFTSYYEVIMAGVLVDLSYGIPSGIYGGYGMFGLLGSFALFLILERIKHELR